MTNIILDKQITVSWWAGVYDPNSDPYYSQSAKSLGIFNKPSARDDWSWPYNGRMGLLWVSTNSNNSINNAHNWQFALATVSWTGAIETTVKSDNFNTSLSSIDSGRVRLWLYINWFWWRAMTWSVKLLSNWQNSWWIAAYESGGNLYCSYISLDDTTKDVVWSNAQLIAFNVSAWWYYTNAEKSEYSITYSWVPIYVCSNFRLNGWSCWRALTVRTKEWAYNFVWNVISASATYISNSTTIKEDGSYIYIRSEQVLSSWTSTVNWRINKTTFVTDNVAWSWTTFTSDNVVPALATTYTTLSWTDIRFSWWSFEWAKTWLLDNTVPTTIDILANGSVVATQSFTPNETTSTYTWNIIIPYSAISWNNVELTARYNNELSVPAKIGFGITGWTYTTPTGTNDLSWWVATPWSAWANGSYLNVSLA